MFCGLSYQAMLHLMDVETELVKEIVRNLCAFFNQESVMVAEGMMGVHFIQERLE